MLKRGYKVTSQNKRSVIRFIDEPSSPGVGYSRESSTLPKFGCGPLTVFKTLEGAVKFRSRVTGDYRLFSCYYIPSSDQEVWSFDQPHQSLYRLMISNLDCIIPGTVDLADEVILGEELL